MVDESRTKLSVLVVDDHPLVRSGVRRHLELHPRIGDIHEAASGDEAVTFYQDCQCDIVLMDLTLPGIGGLEASRQLLDIRPDARILIVTANVNYAEIRQALNDGVLGCLTKANNHGEMDLAIDAIADGKQYLSPEVAQTMVIGALGSEKDNPFDRLSARELEIIKLMIDGGRNVDIAQTLSISEKTVSTHRTRAFRRLGVDNPAELLRLAIRHGLWEDD